jgi:hypothetical protein
MGEEKHKFLEDVRMNLESANIWQGCALGIPFPHGLILQIGDLMTCISETFVGQWFSATFTGWMNI